MMQRVSRRGLLGKGAAGAAVVAVAALPATTRADELVHHAECFHQVERYGHNRARVVVLADRLQETHTPEQRKLYIEIDSIQNDDWCDAQVDLVEELARHLPGVGPAIRSLAYHHLFEQSNDDRGVCCAD